MEGANKQWDSYQLIRHFIRFLAPPKENKKSTAGVASMASGLEALPLFGVTPRPSICPRASMNNPRLFILTRSEQVFAGAFQVPTRACRVISDTNTPYGACVEKNDRNIIINKLNDGILKESCHGLDLAYYFHLQQDYTLLEKSDRYCKFHTYALRCCTA